jgi:phenylpropionate dioxygenase-like ring-hydroxylating dioxygenase large terminal subunit
MTVTARPPAMIDEDEPSKESVTDFYNGLRPFWHPVALSTDLTDKPLSIRLSGRRLVMARLDGVILVMGDTCRHFQAQLSLGEIVQLDGRAALQCAYHGWSFGAGGQCVRIPQLAADRKIRASANLPAFHGRERYGIVWVCMASHANYPIPDFPEYDDPAFRTIRLEEAEPTRTSATRMIMGTLDDTHFPWVHEGILGDRAHPEPPDHRAWRAGNELIVQYETEQPAGIVTAAANAAGPPKVKVQYTGHVGMPKVIRLLKDMAGGRLVVWLAACPVDFKTTRNFWISARNYDLDPARDAVYVAMSAHVRRQDKPIIESQRPWLIPPFWTKIEMPMAPGDVPLMEYQKWLEELGVSTGV